MVAPPLGQGYLNLSPRVADTAGFTPVQLDIQLAKGVVVTGRLIDRQTGKGLRGGVRLAPLPGNKLFGTRPEFSGYQTDHSPCGTGANGGFQLYTIPGPSLIMAQVHEGEQFNNELLSPFCSAVPDPDHKELFHRNGENWSVLTAGGLLEFLTVEHVVKVLDVKASGETTVDLFVERGVKGKLLVQDTLGQPLAGAVVSGLTEHWPFAYRLREATGPVFALDPSRPRMLAIYHAGKRLGGKVSIRGDEKEAVVAKLEPLARVTGRLLDADSQPLAGVKVSLYMLREIDRDLYRVANPASIQKVTDKDGRFAIDGVVPGVRFEVQIEKGKEYYNSKPKIGQCTLKAGETLDLGERVMFPNQ